MNEMSVGLTSMFRDPKFWVKLKDTLPEVIAEKRNMNVWHAGCSTGEEVYTFNIILRQLGLEGRIKSYATDMNTSALEQAQKGVFHILKLHEYEHQYQKFEKNGTSLENFYRKEGKYGHMDLGLISHVKFEMSNLITDTNQNKYDIIFCRNVMIYFDNGAKKMVLDKFYDNLNPKGFLIIGFFDALAHIIDKSKFEFYDMDHKIFRKKQKLN